MKNLILTICLLFVVSVTKAQSASRDSVHKHELSVNIMPVMLLFGGGYPVSNSAFGFGYRCYSENNRIFRLGLSVFPFQRFDQMNGFLHYDRTIGNKNVFKTYSYNRGAKFQLEIGHERLLKVKRFTHGFGAELLLSQNTSNSSENYRWSTANQPFQSNAFGDTTNYEIDSLGYYSYHNNFGIGLHVFYSLRLQISKHFYVSTTFGPSAAFIMARGQYTDRTKKVTLKDDFEYIEFLPVPLISSLSFSLRF